MTEGRKSIGAALICAFFVAAGAATLIDTMSYRDSDSQVFPRAAAILLILSAGAALVVTLTRAAAVQGFGAGDWRRRILLVAAMLGACAAMPVIGFLPASAIAFAGALIAAMHDRWSLRLGLIYGVAGALILAAFYALFRFALLVPLP